MKGIFAQYSFAPTSFAQYSGRPQLHKERSTLGGHRRCIILPFSFIIMIAILIITILPAFLGNLQIMKKKHALFLVWPSS